MADGRYMTVRHFGKEGHREGQKENRLTAKHSGYETVFK